MEVSKPKLGIHYQTIKNNESSFDPSSSCVVQITQNNIDSVLASNEVVFVFTYFENRYGTRMMPILEQVAKELREVGFGPGKVVIAKVNYVKETTIKNKFQYKYCPNFTLFRNGLPSKSTKTFVKGTQTVEAFVEFIKKQLTDPIIPFNDLNELHGLSDDDGHIIAYLDSRDQPEYDVLRKVASSLRDEYRFNVKFGDSAQQVHRTDQPRVVFIIDKNTSDPHETYRGSLLNFDELYSWVQQKCAPLVRVITLENAEELTEEGLPFLVLFHNPSDTDSVKKYKKIIRKELESERQKINFLTADGVSFEHPMHHLGKSLSDLPLIALDSFHNNMYLFPDYNDMEKPGKLKEFLQDFYSGKLKPREVPLPSWRR